MLVFIVLLWDIVSHPGQELKQIDIPVHSSKMARKSPCWCAPTSFHFVHVAPCGSGVCSYSRVESVSRDSGHWSAIPGQWPGASYLGPGLADCLPTTRNGGPSSSLSWATRWYSASITIMPKLVSWWQRTHWVVPAGRHWFFFLTCWLKHIPIVVIWCTETALDPLIITYITLY